MPLANHCRLIARLLQQLGVGLLASVEGFGVVCKAVGMTVFARKHASARGPAKRIGYIAVGKSHAIVGNPVEVWRLDKPLIVCADGLIRVVVAHDIHDIHGLLVLYLLALSRGVGHWCKQCRSR